MRGRWHRVVILAITPVLFTSACAVSGLSFVQDERVKILSPTENEEVALPFTVAWDADDVEESFIVFFDRSPMRPNQHLRSLVPEGDPCRAEPGCPDAQWLADRNVYITEATRLTITSLPDRRDNNRSRDRHDLTIVYLDEDGCRVGESAFTREFIVERER